MSHLASMLTLAVAFCAGVFCTPFAGATDFSNLKSGLLLGVYASPAQGGIEVTGLIPGYSAEGRLLPGDVLMRATTDGLTVHRLRTNYEMENVKLAIGANCQTAVEIMRPGQGLIYAWVEFTPVESPTAAYSLQNKAAFRMESEKPGDQEMFRASSSGNQQTAERLKAGFAELEAQAGPIPFTEPSSDRAASLFRRK